MSVNHPNSLFFVIGITGPIGSGKSLVRKMLEHLGCLTVDADLLAHRVYRRGTSIYHQLIDTFGSQILDQHAEVDRRKLAQIVFSNPEALYQLEALTHPAVISALQRILRASPLPIIAVEAIKLIESGFSQSCDSVWLVDAPQEAVNDRLQKSRGVSPAEISARRESQAAFRKKRKLASLIIHNDGDIHNLWRQVLSAWETLQGKAEVSRFCAEQAAERTRPFK